MLKICFLLGSSSLNVLIWTLNHLNCHILSSVLYLTQRSELCQCACILKGIREKFISVIAQNLNVIQQQCAKE